MTDPLDDPKFGSIATQFFRDFLSTAVAHGELDPRGKSDEEFRAKTAEYLTRLLTTAPEIRLVTDYREALVKHARRFARGRQTEMLACLHYATWCEHWINGVVVALARRRRLQKPT